MRTAAQRTRRLPAVWLAISAVILAMLATISGAEALTAVGGHELDADLEANTEDRGDVDWVPNDGFEPGGTEVAETGIFNTAAEACPPTNAAAGGLAARPNAVVDGGFQATLLCDSVSFPGSSDANIFVGGAKESDPDSQTIKSGPVTPKTDLTHAYARGVIAPDSGNVPVGTGTDQEDEWGDLNNDPDAWVIAAYEVIPKQGSYHTNVEFNQRVRCVTGDEAGEIVDTVTDCGVGAQVTPFRTEGDVLLAVDIGGSNDPAKKIRLLGFIATGGTETTHATYAFGNNETTTIDNADFVAFGGSEGIDNGVVRAAINADTIDCAPYGCFDEGYNHVGTLPAEAFVEVAANLSAFTPNVCLNNVAFKSRASGQSITSQLKDTTNPQPFPFCGGFSVRKYIDPQEDGGDGDGTDDFTTQAEIQTAIAGLTGPFGADTDLGGWTIDVYNDAGITLGSWDASDTKVCTGTTSAAGLVVCSEGPNALAQLTPGKYHIVESSMKSGWQNTDPGGSGPNHVETVDLTLGASSTYWIGNTCLSTMTFTVNGVPSGAAPRIDYVATINGVAGSTVTVTPTTTGTTGQYAHTTSRIFGKGDSVSWKVYDNNDAASKKDATSHTFSGTDLYPVCAASEQVSFDTATLVGFKYKDMDGDGIVDAGDLTKPLAGWEFRITGPTYPAPTGTLVYSDSTGKISLSGLAAGTYRVTETGKVDDDADSTTAAVTATNWERTKPSANAYLDVALSTGETMDGTEADAPIFLNAPLSLISVGFQDLTGSTDVVIACTDASSAAVDINGEAAGTNIDTNGETLETPSGSNGSVRLSQSAVTCTFTITDP